MFQGGVAGPVVHGADERFEIGGVTLGDPSVHHTAARLHGLGQCGPALPQGDAVVDTAQETGHAPDEQRSGRFAVPITPVLLHQEVERTECGEQTVEAALVRADLLRQLRSGPRTRRQPGEQVQLDRGEQDAAVHEGTGEGLQPVPCSGGSLGRPPGRPAHEVFLLLRLPDRGAEVRSFTPMSGGRVPD